MRVYFESRDQQGRLKRINDPHMDGSFDVVAG